MRTSRMGLSALAMGLVLWLGGCAGGGGNVPSRTSTEASGTRPATTAASSPGATTTLPSRPPLTSAEAPTTAEPPRTTEPPTTEPPRTTTAPTTPATSPPTTPRTSPATSAQAQPSPTTAAPAAAESGELGPWGWVLLVVLVGGLIAWFVWRSRQRSAWDAEAGALEAETRTTTSTQLPPVLIAETPEQRALSWPQLRAGLVDLARRWDLLAERASDDRGRNRSVHISRLLQELVAAVDAENQALAAGRDWRLLRPRVDEADRALSAVLAGAPQQEPAAGGWSGPPPPGE